MLVSPINIHWENEAHQLIIAEFNERWNWEEFHYAVHDIHALIAAVPHPVDVIIWHKTDLPPGNPITHLSRTLKIQPPNLGKTVIVSPDMNHPIATFLKSIAAIIQRTYPGKKPVLSADTIEDARRMVARTTPIEIL